jgi:hypothetical protein
MPHLLGTQPGTGGPLSARRRGPGARRTSPRSLPDARRWRTVQGERRHAGPGGAVPGVARRVRAMLQRPVVSYANGREVLITFGQEEAPALALRSPGCSPRER